MRTGPWHLSERPVLRRTALLLLTARTILAPLRYLLRGRHLIFTALYIVPRLARTSISVLRASRTRVVCRETLQVTVPLGPGETQIAIFSIPPSSLAT